MNWFDFLFLLAVCVLGVGACMHRQWFAAGVSLACGIVLTLLIAGLLT